MIPNKKLAIALYCSLGILVALSLLSLPSLHDWAKGLAGDWNVTAWLFYLTSKHRYIIWNLLMLNGAAILIEQTVGFHSGFGPQFREYWRRVPYVFVILVMIIGALALLVNLDRVLLFILEVMPGGSGILAAYESLFSTIFNRIIGFSPTSINGLFLTLFAASLVTGYLKTPEWKHLRVAQIPAGKTLSGVMGIVADPNKRKKLRQAEACLEKHRTVKAAKILESLGEEFCYRAGKLYLERGLEKKAASAFDKAGRFYLKQGNYQRAGDAFFFGSHWEKTVSAYQQFKPPSGFLSDASRVRQWAGRWGEALFRLEKYGEAGELFGNYGLYKRAGEAFEKAGVATRAAEAYGKAGAYDSSFKALQESGQEDLAKVERARFFLQKEDFKKAAPLFEEAGKEALAAEAYAKAGMARKAAFCFQKAGDHKRAAALFLEAGEEEAALGCYQILGDFKKAGQLAAHLGLQDKQAAFFQQSGQFVQAARAFLMIGEEAKAAECLGSLNLETGQSMDEGLQILTILLEQSRPQEALKCAQAMLENHTMSRVLAPLLQKTAYIYERLGNPKEAASHAIKAAKVAPDNSQYTKVARDYAKKAGMSGDPFAKPPPRKTKTVTKTTPEPMPASQTLAPPVKVRKPRYQPEPAFEPDITQTLDDNSVYDLTQDGPLHRYQILKELGRGGMGRVYKARDRKLNRPVALKMLHPELNQEPKILLFFKREVHAIAGLNHPNVVSLFDAGMEKGSFYMIMEFVEGYTLDKLFKKYPDVGRRSLAWIWYQVGQGLQYAHEKGILHRDIKPTNLMVAKNRTVKILDFGLAKQMTDSSKTRQVWGTPAFMAPELFYGQRASIQSDIYALGASFYLLATGRIPYYGDDPAKKFVGDGLPVAPSQLSSRVPEKVSATILKCLYLNPSDRYQTVKELITDVKRSGRP